MLEDDADAVQLTLSVSVVVRVTWAEVLDRFSREVFAARRDLLSPDVFAPQVYQAACDEGVDAVTGGPAGQLRFLINPAAIVAGIPGVGVEDARIVIETTPAEVVHRLREEHGFLEEPTTSPGNLRALSGPTVKTCPSDPDPRRYRPPGNCWLKPRGSLPGS